jgi:hypothetical protein
MFTNLKKIFLYTPSFFTWLISFLLSIGIWYYYSDIEFVAANYRSWAFAYYDVFLSWMMILFFPLVLAGIVYKSLLFGKKNVGKK